VVGEPDENGECRFRRRSASDTSAGSGVRTGLKFDDGGGGMLAGSNVCCVGRGKGEGEGIAPVEFSNFSRGAAG
jgi:hypothetical protein